MHSWCWWALLPLDGPAGRGNSGHSQICCRSLLSFGSCQESRTSVAVQQYSTKWSITERGACDLSLWHHSEKFILSYVFQSPLGPVFLHKRGSLSVFLQKRKYAWESSAPSTWEEKLPHSLLKFSVLDADEWQFLSNFSNIAEEFREMVCSGVFQEELLERASKAI